MRPVHSLKSLFGLLVLCTWALAACGDGASSDTPADADHNACGGDAALTYDGADARPGEACGACGDGILECGSTSELTCVAATEPNACGTCGPLGAAPGDACGACGAWACGDDGALSCIGADAVNACGGCSDLDGEPGRRCESDDGAGIERCVGPDEVQCRPPGDNGCGGTQPLAETPGSACGACGFGVWACDGSDAIVCAFEDRGQNACGGCGLLEGQPGTPCGSCDGTWTCDGDVVTCDASPRNGCGGCDPLPGAPGTTCDGGGQTFCADRESLSCGPPGGNACGGPAPLDAMPGSACGACSDGVVICAGPDATRCAGASETNECGGCGFLPGRPGDPCGPAAVFACDGDTMACLPDATGNVCGGTTDLEATPGDACGTCDAGRVVCDGFDATRCEGGDETVAHAWPDGDDDGFGAMVEPTAQCNLDDGYVRRAGDCDDTRPDVSPDGVETCNDIDDDCDGVVDDEATDAAAWFADRDDDGFGDDGEIVRACAAPDGYVEASGDCDDRHPRRYPGAPEADCTDPVDYDCDGATAFGDADGDGWATCVDACDDDPLRHPGVLERCDGIDNDCDGDIDEGEAVDGGTFYRDDDDDDAGDPDRFVVACEAPDGFVAVAGDCDDDDPRRFFGNTEVCDDVDNDCDGVVDPPSSSDAPTWYPDRDDDDFGDPLSGLVACDAPDGFIANGEDCDDSDPGVNPTPTNVELCDFVDNDCDGAVDEADPRGTRWYPDRDGDGFGVEDEGFVGCTASIEAARPPMTSDRFGDCADDDPSRRPSAFETAGDGVDQDCDGFEECFIDADRDGYVANTFDSTESSEFSCPTELGLGGLSAPDGDCRDDDPDVNPGTIEVVGDYRDQNCDGLELCYRDDDRDGARAPMSMLPLSNLVVTTDVECSSVNGLASADQVPNDCDDSDPTFRPGAPDSARDDLDQNCDGIQGGDWRTVFVSTTGRNGAGCGRTPESPCNTLVIDWQGHPCFDNLSDIRNEYSACGRMNCEFLVAEGTYDESFLRICDQATIVGGYSADFTTRSGDPAATRIDRVREPSGIGGPTLRVDEVSNVDPDLPGDLDRSDIYLRAITIGTNASSSRENNSATAGNAGGPDFVNDTITFDIATRGTVVLDRVIVEGAVGVDAGRLARAHGSPGISIAVRNAAEVSLVDTRVEIGAGGAATTAGRSDAEGGPAVGIALANGAMLLMDDASEVTTTADSAGGAPGPSATVACAGNSRWPGMRCLDAWVGLPAPVIPYFAQARVDADAPPVAAQDIVSAELGDGSISLYASVTEPLPSLDEMQNACALWGGALWTVDSAEEEAGVLEALAGLRVADGESAPLSYAHGIGWLPGAGAPEWLDGAAAGYTNWADGAPITRANDRCALTGPGRLDDPATQWTSDWCGRVEPFICWFPPQRVPCVPDGIGCEGDNVCLFDGLGGASACYPSTGDGRGDTVVNAADPALGRYEVRFARTRDAAQASCSDGGGRLAEPRTVDEQRFVQNLLRVRAPDVTRAWIGAVNRTDDDVFVWTDGSEVAAPLWADDGPGPNGAAEVARVSADATGGPTPDDATIEAVSWTTAPAHALDVGGYVCEWRIR